MITQNNTKKPFPPGSELETQLRQNNPPDRVVIIGEGVTFDGQFLSSTAEIQVIYQPFIPGPDAYQWPVKGHIVETYLSPGTFCYELMLVKTLLDCGASEIFTDYFEFAHGWRQVPDHYTPARMEVAA